MTVAMIITVTIPVVKSLVLVPHTCVKRYLCRVLVVNCEGYQLGAQARQGPWEGARPTALEVPSDFKGRGDPLSLNLLKMKTLEVCT